MFTYNIRGENIEITPAIREYAEKKIGKLEKYFQGEPDGTVYVNAKIYPNRDAKAEVTIPLNRLTLRAEETSQDLYGSIDLVVDKLERQVRKYKTKINRKAREGGNEDLIFAAGADEEVEEQDVDIEIVRTKRIGVKPMSAEEAVLQMEMLGHDFFIFEDAEEGNLSLVYARANGKYGLIEIDGEIV
ncbi:Fis family transcriptional regulator [Aerococcus urinaehominis]|uniref:Ribosome hibernation promoting factor n=1 Tax=Aerococcus urinaehominis TaxID=128944 RepID=A0A0X8FLA9_9LACT|nr:ribosome-associated translation inhibitor RaiA [Aerococcus urinaehominis]AMB99418.1 Fis family transcriptional regulator [Aerococcus urinaehominis]SDM29883.1 ribosomal subunit interface protein [Aerococcus urinaehominis]